MNDNAKAMVLASFAADSLALGAHWIYDTAVITNDIGRVEDLRPPVAGSYHATKNLGDFTHYGDQTLVLLESIAESPGFDLGNFARHWQLLCSDYQGYLDHATKDTLNNFAAGKSPSDSGSASTELGGGSRVAPLVYVYSDDLDKLIVGVRQQTAMTHNDPDVIAGTEFIAATAWHALKGTPPVSAMKKLLPEGTLQNSILNGLESSTMGTKQAIKHFGQSCHISDALPSVVHLIAKYEDNLKEALVENVMAGGDSAARGMLVGMVLGAHLGPDAVPTDWLEKLTNHRKINDLLQMIDGFKAHS